MAAGLPKKKSVRLPDGVHKGTEITRLVVLVPQDIHQQFKALCISQGHGMAWVINNFIHDYLATHKQTKQRRA
jgi:hypothetical protein